MTGSVKRAAERSNDFGQEGSEEIARGAQMLEDCCLFGDGDGSKNEDKGAGCWAECMTKERRLEERRKRGGG